MGKRSFLQRIPLTFKMVFLSVLVGLLAGGVIDYFQARTVKNIFMTQLEERLSQEAQEDRIRFDNYIKAHHQAVRLLTSQQRLMDYIHSEDWQNRSTIRFHRQPPPWLPRTSVLRALITIRHALLLDADGMTLEVYQGTPEPLPEPLLHPAELLRQLSYNQSFMTSIEGYPYLLSSESIRDEQGKILATLMLASPLDRDFLIASQGTYHGRIFALLDFALVSGEKPAILISTEPKLLPSGTQLEDLTDRYLVTGGSLFDYGASDILLGFASFVPVQKVEALAGSVISRDRERRAITVFILITAFGVIMYWVTRQIGRLTSRVSEFTETVLQGTPREKKYGDELVRLEEQYQRLTEEVIQSQETIRRDYRFQRTISSILEMALEPVSLSEQLDRIMRAILDMPFLTPQAKGAIFLLAEDEPDTLVLKAQHGLPQSVQSSCARLPFGRCLCGLAADRQEVVFANCIDELHENICADLDSHGHYCIPIVSGDRKVLGILNLYVDTDHRHDLKEEELLVSVANTLAGIIERHQAQHEKQQLQNELAQVEKLSALGRLTANVAHEIRNPLTLVGGFARRMSKKHEADDDERKYLDIIISEVARLENILMNVLTYSREAKPKLEINDLNSIIDEVLKVYTDKLEDNSIRLHKSLAADPHLQLDRAQIIGALNNLVGNAIDAMPKGGTLTIATGEVIRKGETYLNLVISDTGAGIPADKLKLIFEPFFTTKVLGQGTGLGLPICKRIIEDHGGSISISSEPGRGSDFTIYLPYRQKDEGRDQ